MVSIWTNKFLLYDQFQWKQLSIWQGLIDFIDLILCIIHNTFSHSMSMRNTLSFGKTPVRHHIFTQFHRLWSVLMRGEGGSAELELPPTYSVTCDITMILVFTKKSVEPAIASCFDSRFESSITWNIIWVLNELIVYCVWRAVERLLLSAWGTYTIFCHTGEKSSDYV